MAGVLSYIAIATMIGIWVLGWLGIACIVGSFFELELSTSALLGALLGPLGFVAVIILGIIERSKTSMPVVQVAPNQTDFLDPFA
jgi:tellurite resistance protein TehA-like permease